MRSQLGMILRLACYALAALVVYQLAGVVLRFSPLRHVAIPELPSLPTSLQTGSKSTNSISPAMLLPKGTNSTSLAAGATASTNVGAGVERVIPRGSVVVTGMGGSVTGAPVARQVEKAELATNTVTIAAGAQSNSALAAATVPSNTAVAGEGVIPRSSLVDTGLTGSVTGGPAARQLGKAESAANPAIRPRMAMQAAQASLSPDIQARVNRIVDSEILGPVMRPLPMALLGIAGDFAILRATNGQTGLVKEGDQLSGLKLLRIGTNRVLVELDGQKKELTIFSGYGGDSLLPDQETHP